MVKIAIVVFGPLLRFLQLVFTVFSHIILELFSLEEMFGLFITRKRDERQQRISSVFKTPQPPIPMYLRYSSYLFANVFDYFVYFIYSITRNIYTYTAALLLYTFRVSCVECSLLVRLLYRPLNMTDNSVKLYSAPFFFFMDQIGISWRWSEL